MLVRLSSTGNELADKPIRQFLKTRDTPQRHDIKPILCHPFWSGWKVPAVANVIYILDVHLSFMHTKGSSRSVVLSYSSKVGILTFPNLRALISSALKDVEKGVDPIWVAVPDTLMGISNCHPASATNELL